MAYRHRHSIILDQVPSLMVKNIITILLFSAMSLPAASQRALSLDSCRAMALRNNKQINIARLKQDVALNTRKAARTKYLPHVDVMGGYEFMSKEISILNDGQKNVLDNLGNITAEQIGGTMSSAISDMMNQGIITQQTAEALGRIAGKTGESLSQIGNGVGQSIRDAFRTDTRNIFTASVMLSQPIYMGGRIVAANKIADISEMIAADDVKNKMQNTVYDIDNAYWTVVSLRHKEKLAVSYLELVEKLSEDVRKMIREGVATRADGLKVDVKVNEAEMQLTQVENGVSLAKMLLCQLCGMPISKDITLEDEEKDCITGQEDMPIANAEEAKENRLELKMLKNAIEINRQKTNITRAEYLPQVALTAGYLVTNPNLYNGFEKKFSGVWNVGVIVKMPVWNWFEGSYKIRASKTATSMTMMELEEASEKVELQVNQGAFRVSEADKRLRMAEKNTENAEENLRCANLGFKEGVMDVTDVMTAQTAWLQAKSQKIDAEIDVKLTRTDMKKILGETLY